MPLRPLPRLLPWLSTQWALTVSATSIRQSVSSAMLPSPPNIEGSGDIQYLIHGMYVAANGNTN